MTVKLRFKKFAVSENSIMFVLKLEMKITSFILLFKNLILKTRLKPTISKKSVKTQKLK